MRFVSPPVSLSSRRAPALVALLSLLLVLCALDPAGDYPTCPQGPGLALDEAFNIEQGIYLVEACRSYGLGLLHPQSLREVFENELFLPDHPPLGRVAIALSHNLCRAIAPTEHNDGLYSATCARTAPAVAFALLVFLVGSVAARWYGTAGGVTAAVSLVLMPRLFGHAHLAALETFMGLTYAAALFSVACWWKTSSPPSRKTACLSGLVFGLALLTKIQAILLPIPIVAWAVWHWRGRAIVPLAIWLFVGYLTFFICWPWLWLDPVGHFVEYFGRTTGRVPIFVWYFGSRLSDLEVPWHYAIVMFLTTVPVGLHLLGLLGLCAGRQRGRLEPGEQLVLAALVFPLLLFSLPGVAVYDGVRLFLVSFPLWGIFVGRGGARALAWLKQRWSGPRAYAVMSLFLAAQGYALVTLAPCYLSYYNLLLGGLKGAERVGMTTTYWGDSVTRRFLEATAREVPEQETIVVVPVLHVGLQLGAMSSQSPILRRQRYQLRRWDQVKPAERKYVLLFRRQADLPPELIELLPDAEVVTEVRRQGVQLAAVYRLKP